MARGLVKKAHAALGSRQDKIDKALGEGRYAKKKAVKKRVVKKKK